jgi:hypothetical protein
MEKWMMVRRYLNCVAIFLGLHFASQVSAQESYKLDITGGRNDIVCETYAKELKEAVESSSNGRLNHSSSFHDFAEISTRPFRLMRRGGSRNVDIGKLVVDIDNDGDEEHIFRSIAQSIQQREGVVVGAQESEFISIYFSGYPKQPGYSDIPASPLPYALRYENAYPWEDFFAPENVVKLELPRVSSGFTEDYKPSPFGSNETISYVYSNAASKNYLSINKISAIALERYEGAQFFVTRSLLAEYDNNRNITIRCVVDISNQITAFYIRGVMSLVNTNQQFRLHR